MEFNLINIITFLSIFQALILSSIFFIKKNKYGNQLLSLLMLIYSFQIVFSLSINYYSYLRFTNYMTFFRFLYLTAFLIAPVLYFMILEYYSKFRVKGFTFFLHSLPFIILALYSSIRLLLNKNMVTLNQTRFIILAQSVIYIAAIIIFLKKKNIKIKELFNLRFKNFNDLIKYLLIAYIVLWIINVQIFAIIKYYTFAQWCAYVGSLYALIMFIFITSVLLINLLKPDIFSIKYASSKIGSNEIRLLNWRINNLMLNEKNYKNPELTLTNLSLLIKASEKKISMAINMSFKMNFNEYINYYRIEDAKKMLLDNKFKEWTILEILYEVGFNSKSAFYESFKQQIGCSPTQYRKNKICPES